MAPKTATDAAKGTTSSSAVSEKPEIQTESHTSGIKGKRKRTAQEEDAASEDDEPEDAEEPQWHKGDEKEEAPPSDWQAVYSAQANAYYFWNQKTNETTWTNPLQSETPTAPTPSAGSSKAVSAPNADPKPKEFGGIDPDLAFLDPTLEYGARQGVTGSQQARFNSRTGRFEGADSRTPGHVSEIERYKRQSAFFFDVEGWEKSTDAEQERRKAALAAGEDPNAKKHKPPTKEELARFKERAKEKKRAKQAWLYD